MENEAARHAVVPQKLHQVAVRDHGAVERPKNQKPPNEAFRLADGHAFRLQSAGNDKEQRHTEAPFHD